MSEPGRDEKPEVEPDTQSDPSLDAGMSGDWSSEGGAVPEGPATDPEATDPEARDPEASDPES